MQAASAVKRPDRAPGLPTLVNTFSEQLNEALKAMHPVFERLYEMAKISPQLRHEIHTMRLLLSNAKPGQAINFDFDDKKSIKSAIEELEVQFGPEDTTYFHDAGRMLLKIVNGIKNKSYFDSIVFRYFEEMVNLIWARPWQPEYFHDHKGPWAERLNAELLSFKADQN